MIEVNISNFQINFTKLRSWLDQYNWSDMTGYFVMNETTYTSITNSQYYADKILQSPLLQGKYVAFCNALPFGKIEFATTSKR